MDIEKWVASVMECALGDLDVYGHLMSICCSTVIRHNDMFFEARYRRLEFVVVLLTHQTDCGTAEKGKFEGYWSAWTRMQPYPRASAKKSGFATATADCFWVSAGRQTFIAIGLIHEPMRVVASPHQHNLILLQSPHTTSDSTSVADTATRL